MGVPDTNTRYWACVVLIILTAKPSFGHQPRIRSPQQAIATSLSGLSIARSPQMTAFAQHFTTLANLAISKSHFPATNANNGMIGIDSSIEQLGPILLGHPTTLGRGQLNLNVMSSRLSLDMLDGESLDPTPKPGKLLLDGPNGQVPADLDFHMELQEWAIGLSATYGLTDKLDVSVVLPLLDSHLTVRAAALGMETETETKPFGPGDLTLRLKHQMPRFWDTNWAATLLMQFPSGKANLLHGTGDYWLSSGILFHRTLVKDRADLALNFVMDFDVTDSIQSQAMYGIGTSVMLWPKKLVGVLEFLGRSQFDSIKQSDDTDVFYMRNGRIQKTPLFGFEFPRADYLSLAFGFRAFIGPMTVFVSALYQLNDGGLHDSDIAPSVGIGGNF
jgi:hypothetical protein